MASIALAVPAKAALLAERLAIALAFWVRAANAAGLLRADTALASFASSANALALLAMAAFVPLSAADLKAALSLARAAKAAGFDANA